MSSLDPVTRRELMQQALRAAAIPGAALLFPWLTSAQGHLHQIAPPQPDLLRDYQPRFFSAEDFKALEAFTEILIPTDDAPGAREARCASYIDFVVSASSEVPHTQENWRKAMELLKATGFHAAGDKRRLEIVTEMSAPETDPQHEHPAFYAYRLIKQQTTFAFYTSRQGMIETLDYRGNSYNTEFPACTHPEHHAL